jgi:putative two-component system response regulator
MRDTFPHILIVDDHMPNIQLLESLLRRSGYPNIWSTTDSRDVECLCQDIQPDLILLDLLMPYLDGFAILKQVRALQAAESYIPILVLTADATLAAKQTALELGATDFLTKPFEVGEVRLRTRNLLETRRLYLLQQDQNHLLERRVRERTRDLEDAQIEIVERLARAAEQRDDITGSHIQRVAKLAGSLARALGLPEAEAELIQRAAPLHDIGKIGIPDHILLKPGKLTPHEFTEMQKHTTIGAGILSGSRHPLLQYAEVIALTHHERWNGSGYPQGLQGETIPLAGRIVAIVDTFDAMITERPYKTAWPVKRALAEIAQLSGQHFDPEVVAAFLQHWQS